MNRETQRILIVDDSAVNREVLRRMAVGLGYETEDARDGFEALMKAKLDIDLVLLDAVMPGMDGFEVARYLRQDEAVRHVPIIMVTSLDSREDRLRAIECGINDFVNKSFDETELRARIGSLLRMKEAQDALLRERETLRDNVERRTADLRRAYQEAADAQREAHQAYLNTINCLALAAESKDENTAAHIRRVSLYCVAIARGLKLAPHEVELIQYASPMHDVGKIRIPPAILTKPGRLTAEERETMNQHTVMGSEILSNSPSEVLRTGEAVALAHHEKWDGSGYPRCLKGEAIHLYGRICAVADVFDALTTRRPYKRALPVEEAYAALRDGRGTDYDPRCVDVFFQCREQVEAIHQEYAETAAADHETCARQ
ncbi:MAG: response regulator [Armatimonadetes bacterium]|nr:response regulator [Armatimonadota bacterium]